MPHARHAVLSAKIGEIPKSPWIVKDRLPFLDGFRLQAAREIENEADLHIRPKQEVLAWMTDPVVAERPPNLAVLW